MTKFTTECQKIYGDDAKRKKGIALFSEEDRGYRRVVTIYLAVIESFLVNHDKEKNILQVM